MNKTIGRMAKAPEHRVRYSFSPNEAMPDPQEHVLLRFIAPDGRLMECFGLWIGDAWHIVDNQGGTRVLHGTVYRWARIWPRIRGSRTIDHGKAWHTRR